MARIDDYGFGHITIDGRDHSLDVIVLPSRVIDNWWRREGHSLALEDFDGVLDELPRHLVVGTGAHGRMQPPPDTIAALEERGHTVEVLTTDRAVRRYSELDESEAALAAHLTC
jgi:hypothetical protein